MPRFSRYIGIDYSGAETCDSSCKGLRVYTADGVAAPEPVRPPPSPRRYWTRRGLAEWLRSELDRDPSTLVGIDHAFWFPLAYFERHRLDAGGARDYCDRRGDTGYGLNVRFPLATANIYSRRLTICPVMLLLSCHSKLLSCQFVSFSPVQGVAPDKSKVKLSLYA